MPTILIVDDDPSIRALFSRALRQLGDVDEAPGGADAMRMLGAKRYDVVTLDLHMPVIDGLVILQMLATKPGPNANTPVFVVSADTTDRARVEALRRKALFFLTKPVHVGMLQSLVGGALRNGRTGRPPRQGSIPDVDPIRPEGSLRDPLRHDPVPAAGTRPPPKKP